MTAPNDIPLVRPINPAPLAATAEDILCDLCKDQWDDPPLAELELRDVQPLVGRNVGAGIVGSKRGCSEGRP